MQKMNNYDITTTGRQDIEQDPIIRRIISQYEKKRAYFEERQKQRNNIKSTMEFVLPLAQTYIENTGAKQVGDMEDMYYATGVLHQIYNFLTSTKLFPDYVDYVSDMSVDPAEKLQIERNLSNIMLFARNKGKYEVAANKARIDLIYGECFLYRDYEVNKDGENIKLVWEHVDWEDVRMPYDDTDWIIIKNWSKDTYLQRYGEKMLKKVVCGKLIDNETSKNMFGVRSSQANDDIIQEIVYIDPAQKVFAKIHGANGYVMTKLEGDEFPFVDSDGTTFSPIKRRMFYQPPYGYHGWGPLDFVLPVAKLDTIIMNASANRAVLEADPLILIQTNDTDSARKMFNKYRRNRSRGQTEPFFVSSTNSGTSLGVQNVSLGANNANFAEWKNQIIQDVIMRTGINVRVLTEFAPTAEQQRLRKMEEDKLNLGVMLRNADSDREMAQEDLYILKNTKSVFHNKTVYIEPLKKHTDGLTEEELNMLYQDNEMTKVPVTIREFFDELKDIEFTVSARLEGALDNTSYLELQALKENLMLIPQGTIAYNKALSVYLEKTSPQFKIRREDIVPEQPINPPMPNEQPDEQLAIQ